MTEEARPVLYITYDGLTDPLGRSQVLPYLVGLAERGHRIHILSCEKPDRMRRDGDRIRQICAAAKLEWHPLKYRSRPPVLAAAFNAAMLRRAAARLHRRHRFGLTHCRSYIPGAAGLDLKRRYGIPFLFDMRGFWPDERVEGNSWSLSHPLYRRIYRHFKALEARLLSGANAIVSLTYEGKAQLLTRPELQAEDPNIAVIPCCVDFGHFPLVDQAHRDRARAELGIPPGAYVLAYLGSLGAWYMLDEMLDFFRIYRERHADALFLFVTQDLPEAIRDAAIQHGVPAESLVIRPASREQVPELLAAVDLGIFFIQPVFSKKASSPTKMGEMLALGMPIITNAGVGDVAQIVDETGCGVAIRDFDEAAYQSAIDVAEAAIVSPAERRRRALPWFDVEIGIERYDALYRQLAAGTPADSR